MTFFSLLRTPSASLAGLLLLAGVLLTDLPAKADGPKMVPFK